MTIRDELIDRLTAVFGQAAESDEYQTWTYTRKGLPNVRIMLNSLRTPQKVAVWVFDPHEKANSAHQSCIENSEQVNQLMHMLHERFDLG